MTPEEREKYNNKTTTIVVVRSCRAKIEDEGKVKDFAVGAEITLKNKYADELISLGKAVEKGSPKHEKWVADEKKKAASQKELAPAAVSQAEAISELVTSLKEFTAAVTAALDRKKGK